MWEGNRFILRLLVFCHFYSIRLVHNWIVSTNFGGENWFINTKDASHYNYNDNMLYNQINC